MVIRKPKTKVPILKVKRAKIAKIMETPIIEPVDGITEATPEPIPTILDSVPVTMESRPTVCTTCNGTGLADNNNLCTKCAGTGK